MAKDSPPLLGFNNNVRHRGRVFHIQTEDSGVKYPRIVTHLFADGGRIVRTTRTDYAEHVGQNDMMPIVRRMMKEQHKAMFIALRAGELDVLLEEVCGPLASTPSNERITTSETLAAIAPPPSQFELSAPSGALPEGATPALGTVAAAIEKTLSAAGASPEPSELLPIDLALERELRPLSSDESATTLTVQRRPPPIPKRGKTPPLGTPSEPPAAVDAGRYAASRPAAIFGQVPSAEQHSIFGDSVISEKSLDEVILSYLAEDLESTPQK